MATITITLAWADGSVITTEYEKESRIAALEWLLALEKNRKNMEFTIVSYVIKGE